MQISKLERRMLINQYRILAALYPKEAAYHQRSAEILERGYYELWADEAVGWLSEPLSREEMIYVSNVFDMFDWLQISFDELPDVERAEIDPRELIFGGFDGNNESDLMGYARFLREKLERYTNVRIHETLNLNSHCPTGDRYARMLKVLPKRDGLRRLSAAEIKAVLRAQFVRAAA
jgi:uncharacterized protein